MNYFSKRRNFNIHVTDDFSYIADESSSFFQSSEDSIDRQRVEFNKDKCPKCDYYIPGARVFCSRSRCKLDTREEEPEALVESLARRFSLVNISKVETFQETKITGLPTELELSTAEIILYRYLGTSWRELCYFYLRGISQIILASFLGVAQTLISYLQRRLLEILVIFDTKILPLLIDFSKLEPIFLKFCKEDDLEFMKICLLRASVTYTKNYYAYSSGAIKQRFEQFLLLFEDRSKIRNSYYDIFALDNLTKDEFQQCQRFVESVREKFFWNILGREPKFRESKDSKTPTIRHSSSRYSQFNR